MKYEDILIIHDENYDKICFVYKKNNKLEIFTKDILFKNFVENLIKDQTYKAVGGSNGDVCWDGVEKIEVDNTSYMICLYEKVQKKLFAYESRRKVFIGFLDNIKKEYLNKVIKKVWLTMIPEDYNKNFLLYEDSLKNSLYHHLRTELTELMECTNIRIYPEYQTYRKEEIRARIDIAIVEFSEFPLKGHLGDAEIEILSAIEIKYKNSNNDDDILLDVKKCVNYLDKLHGLPQIYLVVLQEAIYDCNEYSFLDEYISLNHEKVHSKERLTELLGYIPLKNEESEEMEFKVVTYNKK